MKSAAAGKGKYGFGNSTACCFDGRHGALQIGSIEDDQHAARVDNSLANRVKLATLRVHSRSATDRKHAAPLHDRLWKEERMFRLILSGPVLSSVLTLIVSILVVVSAPITTPAQCPGVCGDLTGDSAGTSVDLLALFDWVHQSIPPPGAPECGDVDSYEGLTLRDPIMWMRCFPKASSFAAGCEDLSFDCNNLPFGPYTPSVSDAYKIVYNDIFPAGDSVVTLKLHLRANEPLFGFTAPLGVRVNGEIPEFTNLVADLTNLWTFQAGRYDVPGAPEGHVLLGYSVLTGLVNPGFRPLARIDLHLSAAAFDRTIELEWLNIAPDSTHMAVDVSFEGWELNLSPCHVTVPGDVNNDHRVTSTDVIWMINHLFKGGPEPVLCSATGDANCSGDLTSADIIRLVGYIFLFREAPCDICALISDGVWSCP